MGSDALAAAARSVRESGSRAIRDIAGNLGSNISKLSDAFGAGGWAARFKPGAKKTSGGGGGGAARDDAGPGPGGTKAPGAGAERDGDAATAGVAAEAASAAGEDGSEAPEAGTPRESKATKTLREDVKRTEDRRDALVARKTWLRELLVSQTPPTSATKPTMREDAKTPAPPPKPPAPPPSGRFPLAIA